MNLTLLAAFCICAFTLCVGFHALLTGLRSRFWPTASGQILSYSFRIVDHIKNIGTPGVRYSYAVKGEVFFSDRITMDGFCVDAMTAGKIQSDYPIGSEVRVHYKPGDPRIAVLKTGIKGGSVLVVLISAFFLYFITPILFRN
jgi:hypothetical protein